MHKSKMHRLYDINGWAFVATAVGLIALMTLYPIGKSLWLSLHSGRGVILEFAGVSNVIRLFYDPMFKKALWNTLTFLAIQVPIMIFLSLAVSSCLNSSKLRYKQWFRLAIFLPCVTSLVAYSILFKSMFELDGVVNSVLMAIHIISEPIPWLADPFWAKVTVIIAITWRWTGYNMIFFLSAMQNIDKSIYEAARIDGVSPIKQFLFITVPLLKPVILFTTVTSTIGTLQLFDEAMNITNGGPANSTMTLSLYIYNLSFSYVPNFGYAATVSYVIVVLSAVLAVVQFKAARNK
ncbi:MULTISPECIES: carbohydrate ABC transporter permease [Vibrio]|uniref:Sugar ABC transporter permease n=1 Tax=Vibrio diazotrophicus TaxID=685 RepID=A0A2J8FY25_VIBDI|nr:MULTISPECIES: sugar ABC transporter permease [Vibrio]MCF7362010.1 sugar ABC transporter permease [Vibrio sp. A1-b2]MCZ4370237.1 sugar ABC transporter permease [Vibrio diazotrophicus]PNH78663.1 sugar ABC transporter permease [Vibrio diazotrophicus]PNI00307.1 sugar ABC transporter permease [Vibrio diazotrophicus]PNI06841.1 sugar ABC transporter permease [Vibrio diazotrophicus]